MIPLPKTVPRGNYGKAELRPLESGKLYPHCSKHGAMNRVSEKMPWYRCLACNIGVELIP